VNPPPPLSFLLAFLCDASLLFLSCLQVITIGHGLCLNGTSEAEVGFAGQLSLIAPWISIFRGPMSFGFPPS